MGLIIFLTFKLTSISCGNEISHLISTFRLAQVTAQTKSCRKILLYILSTSCHPLFALRPWINPLVTLVSTLKWPPCAFFVCGFRWLTSICMYCIFSLRLCKRCWVCIQHSIENAYEFVPQLCCQWYTYKSAVAQSFVSVAEADTSWYGPWHCQHEAPPLPPPQKLWLLKGSIHHWTSVLWFDTIVQILPFCPLSPRFLASDLFPFLSGFFLSLSDGWIQKCCMQFFFSYHRPNAFLFIPARSFPRVCSFS